MGLAVPGSANRQGRVRIWDLPTRVCHWSLAGLVAAAFVTGWIGGNAMAWHGRAGIAIVGLLAFRIVWGLIGSTYARFARFVRGPAAIRDYLQGRWRGGGHNPLGALSVLGMLFVLTFQAAAGLAGNDDIAFNGPLYALTTKATSDWLTGLHRANAWLVAALVALHVGAIAYYVRVKGENLVLPMLRGWQERNDNAADSASGGGALAFMAALSIALAAAWAASGAWLPPPPPASAAPAW